MPPRRVNRRKRPSGTSNVLNTLSKWPLALHVVYDQAASTRGLTETECELETFAKALCLHLSGGERAARVPVRLWRSQNKDGERRLPTRVPLEGALKNVVVVLVDQGLFELRHEWEHFVRTLVEEARPENDIILPVAIHADAARVAKAFGDINHIVVRNPAKLAEDEFVFQAVYTSVLRLLVDELPSVFLCHAKADGGSIARKVRRYLYEQSQISCFFDLHDIPHGHKVKKSIEDSIHKSVVLAIWTDKLLDSAWCQFEIIEARRQQCPMLVLDALSTKTPRLFPFLGNMPVVRWKRNPSSVVTAILLELIRAHHLESIFHSCKDDKRAPPSFGLHPPDILGSSLAAIGTQSHDGASSTPRRSRELFIYPDPPLKPGELEVLRQTLSNRRFLSLIEWQALRAANALNTQWDSATSQRPAPLRAMRIGISVSASDTWADMGLISQHQDDLAYNIALQLILLGTKVVWGGDLRPDGFGDQLRWIVQAYQHPTHAPQDHVAMVAPFSLIPEMALDSRAVKARRAFAEVRLMDCPVAASALSKPLDAESAAGRAISAMALSVMRAELAEECHARIILGGGLRKFQGIYPGIAEEAYEAVRNRRPLYVLGGFGGAARAVYAAISNSRSQGVETLVRASRHNGAAADKKVRSAHAALIKASKRPELSFSPEVMANAFSELGVSGLSERNGLSVAENDCLSRSEDVHEILELIVKGLTSIEDPH